MRDTHSLPLENVETRRLIIAPLRFDEADALANLTNDPAIIARIAFLKAPFGVDEARALITADPGFNGIRRKTDGQLIGVFGVHPRADQTTEIGYWIGTAFQRQGYAREAGEAIITVLQGRSVYAECAPENVTSWHFLETLGFRPTGEAGLRPGRSKLVRCNEIPQSALR